MPEGIDVGWAAFSTAAVFLPWHEDSVLLSPAFGFYRLPFFFLLHFLPFFDESLRFWWLWSDFCRGTFDQRWQPLISDGSLLFEAYDDDFMKSSSFGLFLWPPSGFRPSSLPFLHATMFLRFKIAQVALTFSQAIQDRPKSVKRLLKRPLKRFRRRPKSRFFVRFKCSSFKKKGTRLFGHGQLFSQHFVGFFPATGFLGWLVH